MSRKSYFFITYLVLAFAFFSSQIQAQEVLNNNDGHIAKYLQFMKVFDDQMGPIGHFSKGEIEIILDPHEIQQIERNKCKALEKIGVSTEEARRWSRIGVIDSGASWILIRDPVILPSGRKTTRHRLKWKTAIGGPGGVAMLPVTKDNKILLCVKYRHALRSFHVELPRGKLLYGETAERASQRELRSEVGFTTSDQQYLGNAAEGTSFGHLMPVFLCHVDVSIPPSKDDGRAILGVLYLSKEEVKKNMADGFIPLKIDQEVKKIAFNDACLAYAILQAETRGLI